MNISVIFTAEELKMIEIALHVSGEQLISSSYSRLFGEEIISLRQRGERMQALARSVRFTGMPDPRVDVVQNQGLGAAGAEAPVVAERKGREDGKCV